MKYNVYEVEYSRFCDSDVEITNCTEFDTEDKAFCFVEKANIPCLVYLLNDECEKKLIAWADERKRVFKITKGKKQADYLGKDTIQTIKDFLNSGSKDVNTAKKLYSRAWSEVISSASENMDYSGINNSEGYFDGVKGYSLYNYILEEIQKYGIPDKDTLDLLNQLKEILND